MTAGEMIAKAAHCAADDDIEGYQTCVNEACRLALLSAKLTKQLMSAEDKET